MSEFIFALTASSHDQIFWIVWWMMGITMSISLATAAAIVGWLTKRNVEPIIAAIAWVGWRTTWVIVVGLLSTFWPTGAIVFLAVWLGVEVICFYAKWQRGRGGCRRSPYARKAHDTHGHDTHTAPHGPARH